MSRSTARAPYGFEDVVALERAHRVLLPGGGTPEFCRKLNALAISASEFVPAGRDYPIVFASSDRGKTYQPVVVLALEAGTNLFVNGEGEWDRNCYLPAYVRRYPFCLTPSGVVCVAKSYIDKGGVALYDKAGDPTPDWRPLAELLTAFYLDLDRTARFCTALARLQLLEPFTAAMDEPPLTVQGMSRVDEARLSKLAPAQFKALSDKGYLGLIYAHLHSLEGFARLAGRVTARRGAGKGSPASRRSRPR
jgi:hypothetical protein